MDYDKSAKVAKYQPVAPGVYPSNPSEVAELRVGVRFLMVVQKTGGPPEVCTSDSRYGLIGVLINCSCIVAETEVDETS